VPAAGKPTVALYDTPAGNEPFVAHPSLGNTSISRSVTASVSCCAPPVPVFPPSCIPTVSTMSAVSPAALVYRKPPAVINALMSDTVPVRVTTLAEPPTVIPDPLMADKVPLGTENVAVTFAAPASGSAKLIPLRAVARPSTNLMIAGRVTDGAVFTASMLTVRVAEALVLVPSFTAKLTVLADVFGAAEVSLYVTDRNAACHCAKVAVAPDEVSVSTPVTAS